MSNTYQHFCATCAVRDACVYTFGAYYAYKSHGGIGCDCPTGDVKWATDVMRRATPTSPAGTSQKQPTQTARTAKSGEWRKYVVTHLGRPHTTAARSEAEAVNNVRYKLYHSKPLSECPPFSATLAERPMSKDDILARLRRMTA